MHKCWNVAPQLRCSELAEGKKLSAAFCVLLPYPMAKLRARLAWLLPYGSSWVLSELPKQTQSGVLLASVSGKDPILQLSQGRPLPVISYLSTKLQGQRRRRTSSSSRPLRAWHDSNEMMIIGRRKVAVKGEVGWRDRSGSSVRGGGVAPGWNGGSWYFLPGPRPDPRCSCRYPSPARSRSYLCSPHSRVHEFMWGWIPHNISMVGC